MSSSDASGELASAYATLRGGLLTWFTRRVEDPDTAEDLVQLVFAKALAASRRDGIAGKLVPWLHAIARNVLVDHYRSRRPMHPLPEDLAQDAGEDRASEQALAGCLRAFTEELPAIYRDVLLETEFERKTLGEVADQLGVSLSAVKSRASRGRTKLKGLLLSCCDVEQLPSGAVADHSPRPGGCCANTQCCD
ncbi:MAG: sigma-70 family RNA polymerase sigma factor [Pseudomonadota bacterium]